MKIIKFQTEESWLEARRCKITGTRLKDIVVKRGTGQKIGFYELIAERIALPRNGENPMERGHRLEEEAICCLEKELGKKFDKSLVLWTTDEDENIAVSPDGFCGEEEGVEVKCLSSARHVEALLTNKIPSEYEMQYLQYFIVNKKLQTLYFCFYDPSLTVKQFFFFKVKREEIEEEITQMLAYQQKILEEVNKIVNSLTF